MLVVVVDARDVGVGHDDVGQVAQGLDAVGEADGQEGEGEACRGEEGFGGERGAAVSVVGGVSFPVLLILGIEGLDIKGELLLDEIGQTQLV